jgi:endogenous inhibitor of DNA gyrase (YacG/DUF329 family)
MICPTCKKPVSLGDPEMPFCSPRCRLIDLGMWADEEYRIPTTQVAPPQQAPSNPEDDAGE